MPLQLKTCLWSSATVWYSSFVCLAITFFPSVVEQLYATYVSAKKTKETKSNAMVVSMRRMSSKVALSVPMLVQPNRPTTVTTEATTLTTEEIEAKSPSLWFRTFRLYGLLANVLFQAARLVYECVNGDVIAILSAVRLVVSVYMFGDHYWMCRHWYSDFLVGKIRHVLWHRLFVVFAAFYLRRLFVLFLWFVWKPWQLGRRQCNGTTCWLVLLTNVGDLIIVGGWHMWFAFGKSESRRFLKYRFHCMRNMFASAIGLWILVCIIGLFTHDTAFSLSGFIFVALFFLLVLYTHYNWAKPTQERWTTQVAGRGMNANLGGPRIACANDDVSAPPPSWMSSEGDESTGEWVGAGEIGNLAVQSQSDVVGKPPTACHAGVDECADGVEGGDGGRMGTYAIHSQSRTNFDRRQIPLCDENGESAANQDSSVELPGGPSRRRSTGLMAQFNDFFSSLIHQVEVADEVLALGTDKVVCVLFQVFLWLVLVGLGESLLQQGMYASGYSPPPSAAGIATDDATGYLCTSTPSPSTWNSLQMAFDFVFA